MSQKKTDQMRVNVILYRLRELAAEHRRNAVGLGATSRKIHEYTASQIENFIKTIQVELGEVRWIEVKD